MKKPYRLKKRGKVWYYKLAEDTSFRSTGKTSEGRAHTYVVEEVLPKRGKTILECTLGEYLEPFFIFGTCPHIRRLQEDRKNIGLRYVKDQRSRLKNYIFTDPIAKLPVASIKRGQVLDFRSRLIAQDIGVNTVNKIIGILKIAYNEGIYREELERNPTLGIGNIRYEKTESGIFTSDELKAMFENIPGIWKSGYRKGKNAYGLVTPLQVYTAFFIAAATGMRRSEILALSWKQIDFKDHTIAINRAWKDTHTIGLPKWEKVRNIPVIPALTDVLTQLRDDSLHIQDDDFVFHYDSGEPLKVTFWGDRFRNTLDRWTNDEGKLIIDRKKRGLKPHSFRHTLNSLLLDKGADPLKVQLYLGWSSSISLPVLTRVQSGYTHLEDYLGDVVSTIETILDKDN